MSSTAVTAIFIPVALRIAQSADIGPGRLMMPLSMAALISGMTTLVATAPNLVLNSELERHGVPGFRFFSFTPFGVPILILGIVYMCFARRWLTAAGEAKTLHRPSLAEWIAEYKLADREYRLRVTDRSPLAGKTLEGLKPCSASGASIVAIERNRKYSRQILRPTAKTKLKVDDILLIELFAPKGRHRGASSTIGAGGDVARRGLLHRPLAGDRHGGGHPASELGADRRDGDRAAAGGRRARAHIFERTFKARRHAAVDRSLERHRTTPLGQLGSGHHQVAGRARRSAPGPR